MQGIYDQLLAPVRLFENSAGQLLRQLKWRHGEDIMSSPAMSRNFLISPESLL